MAFRNDISINWNVSPRVITIAAPSTEITMQDLHDTLVILEDDLVNLSYKRIVDSSGKQPLGGGTKVGITLSLLNAQIAFEGRTGPTWVLCSASGGNLVAFDTDGVTTINQIYNTPYVNVALTSSASATLQEQDALQYSSYGNVVSVDDTSPWTGTDYPVGNMEYPVNNIEDAVAIAEQHGFATIQIRGDYDIDTAIDLDGYVIDGQNPTLSHIVVSPIASVFECQFTNATVSGTLDGDSEIINCIVDGLSYVSGRIRHSGITAQPVVLGGNSSAIILDCWSEVPGDGTPTIDVGGSGQTLAVRGYDGGLKITNRTGTDAMSIDFSSGQFIADSTITDGIIYVRGTVGKLTINCDEALIDTYGVTNPRTIAEATMSYSRP